MSIVYILLWLAGGYAFTFWFVNYFLDNRRFADTGQEPGPVMLVGMTIVGPLMAAIMALLLVVEFVVDNFSEGFKRFYGMRR